MANFCNNCGTALTAGAQFCGSCGTPAVATPPPPQQPYTPPYAQPGPSAYAPIPPYVPPPQPSNNLPWIIAGGIVLLLAIAVAALFITRDKADGGGGVVTGGPGPVAGAPAETAAVGPEVIKYVTSQANIRNIATALGPDSRVVGSLRRGQQVRGVMHQGLSGDSYWLKLSDGRGYVSAINLSDGPPGPETAAPAPVASRPIVNGTWCGIATQSGNLRIRNTPGGRIIGGIPRGSRVIAYYQTYDRGGFLWIQIQPNDGRYPVGWVLANYLSC